MKKLFLTGLFSLPLILFSQPLIDWAGCYGSFYGDQSNAIAPTPEGGTIAAGYATGNDGDVSGMHLWFGSPFYDGWVVKTSATGEILWQRCYGGSQYENFEAINVVPGNGYILCGESATLDDGDVTGHHGGISYDAWIVKINEDGNIEWQKSLGGTDDEYAADIKPTLDGGYIVSCRSQSDDGDLTSHYGTSTYFDLWVVKLDSIGNIVWTKVLGGTKDEYAGKISVNADGSFTVVGNSESKNYDVTDHHGPNTIGDQWVVKLSNTGEITWTKSLGTSDYHEVAYDIIQTEDSGFMIEGIIEKYDDTLLTPGTHGAVDYYITKLDGDGVEIWHQYYGSTGTDWGRCIAQSPDHNYMIGGSVNEAGGQVTGTFHASADIWLLKIDETGNIIWNACYGGSAYDECHAINFAADGSILLAGDATSTDGDVTGLHGDMNYDYWILKLEAECLLPVAGFTYSDTDSIYSFNADSSNANEWNWDFGDGSFSSEENPVHEYSDTGLFHVCLVEVNICGSDSICNDIYYSMPADTTNDTTTTLIQNDIENLLFTLFPNPVSGNSFSILFTEPGNYEIIITDIRGNIFQRAQFTGNSKDFIIQTTDLPNGIYFVQVQTDFRRQTLKLIVI